MEEERIMEEENGGYKKEKKERGSFHHLLLYYLFSPTLFSPFHYSPLPPITLSHSFIIVGLVNLKCNKWTMGHIQLMIDINNNGSKL